VRRHKIQCSSGHYSVDTVEQRVEELYRTVRLDPKVQEQVRAELRCYPCRHLLLNRFGRLALSLSNGVTGQIVGIQPSEARRVLESCRMSRAKRS
jgi:hypothetical protein